MIDYNHEIKPRLSGLWGEIFESIGVAIPRFKGKNSVNGPCPLCGGEDRAHWRDNDGHLCLYCRSCAADTMHSPEKVFMDVCNVSFPVMVEQLANYINHVPVSVHAEIKHQQATIKEPEYSAILPEQECNEYLKKLQHVPLNNLTLRHGLGLNGLMVNKDFNVSIPVIKKFGNDKKVCNVATIHNDERIEWLAGKSTQFGYCTVGERRKGKPVYVCGNWVDSQIAHIVTGAEIICAFTLFNMRDILWQYADLVSKGMIRAVCNRDYNELAEVEKVIGCQVILPIGEKIKECNFKFEKMIYSASDLLDNWNK